jgi:hypothetical protein
LITILPVQKVVLRTFILLQGLSLLTGIAFAGRSDYTAISDGKDGLSESFDNGYTITYFCKKNGIVSSVLDTRTAENPDECAQACEAHSGCKGSSWLWTSQECQIFGEGDAGEAVRATVFMRRDSAEKIPETPEDEEKAGADCTKEEHALKDCEASEKELTEDFAECQAEKKKGDDEKEECLDRLDQAQAICDARVAALRNPIPNCPTIHGKTAKYGSKTFKTWCNSYLNGATTTLRRNILPFDECLAACSTDAACKGVQYIIDADTPCKMQTAASGGSWTSGSRFAVAAQKV